ncbi:hypothetical protein DL96DRAFT_1102479 [Flagelloscypha sp. PMI_526]|nr:hypothetical protein DL96DRAFT_1102479 [Flagelloscypha sp. PMI_526]
MTLFLIPLITLSSTFLRLLFFRSPRSDNEQQAMVGFVRSYLKASTRSTTLKLCLDASWPSPVERYQISASLLQTRWIQVVGSWGI